MEQKIIVTTKELHDLIAKSYNDGFKYGEEFEDDLKKSRNSNGRDVYAYTRNKIKEFLKITK